MGVLAAVVSIGVGGGTSNAVTKSRQGIFNQVQAAVDSYIATSTANVLTLSACDAPNCDTVTNAASMTAHYGSDGVLGSAAFATGGTDHVFDPAGKPGVPGGG